MKRSISIVVLVMMILVGCQTEIERVPELESDQVRVAMGVCIPPRYAATRQSDAVTQSAGTAEAFRGIGQMTLLAFDGAQLPTVASTIQIQPIDLGGVAKGELTSMKNYKFFEDKPLNIGVSHAVVYAEAAIAEGGDAANGVLMTNYAWDDMTGAALSELQFALKPMADAHLSTYQSRLAYILNDIINAQIIVQGTDECDYWSVSENTLVKHYTAETGTPLLWKNLVGEQAVGEVDNEMIDLDDQKLCILFDSLSNLRSGSAASVLDAVRTLYHVLGTYTMGTHAIEWRQESGETKIRPLATSETSADGYADPAPGYHKLIIDRRGLKEAIQEKIQLHFALNTAGTEVTGYREDDAYNPGSIQLPDGATPIVYNRNAKAFTYSDAEAILPSDRINTAAICYPASLYYTVNSPIRTRATELHDADKLQVNTASAWSNALITGGLWGADKTGPGKEWQTSVQNDTRTIVLTENIHYGVALLETSVRVASATLQDNNRKRVGDNWVADPNLLAVPTQGFPITGILVGSQPDRVGWDMHYTGGEAPGMEATSYTQTIYDHAGYAATAGVYPVTARYSNSVFSEPLRTLCLESQEWSHDNDNGQLYIAIELINNTGMAFVGVDGIVPADGKFYLLAKLDLETDATNGITNVNGQGIGQTLRHVLQQGYKTQARLTIASLKNAYNTIPDLRLTKLAFGMSVDLMWQQGAVFEM